MPGRCRKDLDPGLTAGLRLHPRGRLLFCSGTRLTRRQRRQCLKLATSHSWHPPTAAISAYTEIRFLSAGFPGRLSAESSRNPTHRHLLKTHTEPTAELGLVQPSRLAQLLERCAECLFDFSCIQGLPCTTSGFPDRDDDSLQPTNVLLKH